MNNLEQMPLPLWLFKVKAKLQPHLQMSTGCVPSTEHIPLVRQVLVHTKHMSTDKQTCPSGSLSKSL